jgi:hypothetical protein
MILTGLHLNLKGQLMENNTNSVSWLHGLEDYFRFKKNNLIADMCADFLKVVYSENKAPTLRNVVCESLSKTPSNSDVYNVLNFFAHSANLEDNMKLKEISSALAVLFPEEPIFKIINKFYRQTQFDLSDAFSRSQVKSKIWLVTELAKIQKEFDNVVILAGWHGQLIKYFDEFTYNRIKNVELDPAACLISDDIVNLDLIQDYKVKAVHADINTLALTKKGYEFQIENFKNPDQKKFSERFSPNLIINTSAEHMGEEWFNTIRFKELESNPIVVIQSNNLFDIEEHVNCVHSIDHMKKKFPMREILYEGELQLQGYKRIMLIGRP